MLVYENVKNHMQLHPRQGTPAEDQFKGTDAERLCEMAGRICYDSFGKGRSSKEYHKHIKEVGHFSVYEHYNFTVHVDISLEDLCLACRNRPGIWIEPNRVTVNLRCILEWDKWNMPNEQSVLLGKILKQAGNVVAPAIVDDDPGYTGMEWAIVDPIHEEEIWMSFYLEGSRGFSHEQVRHGDRTAISQRSTRYVDESESDMCWHPLLDKSDWELSTVDYVTSEVYKRLVEKLVFAGASRKAARGAARGALPNALFTNMIFSASLAQWRRMCLMRNSIHADGEIRQVYQQQVIPWMT